MWLEIALVIAGLVYAIAQNARTAAAPIITVPTDETADSRFHVQYLQQLLAVQAAQIANSNALYGFLLPVVLFLLQFVAAPIQNPFAHWFVFGGYSLLALFMLAFLGMRRPELYSSQDPLAVGAPVKLTDQTLTASHGVLHRLLEHNERALRAKHRPLPWILLAGILITIIGGAFDGTQAQQPQTVSFPTPVPVIVQTPKPTPTAKPTPAPTKAPTPSPTPGKQPGKPPAGAKAPSINPTPSVKPRLAPSGIMSQR